MLFLSSSLWKSLNDSFISELVKNSSNQFIVQNILLWLTTERFMKVSFSLSLYLKKWSIDNQGHQGNSPPRFQFILAQLLVEYFKN